MTGSADCSKSEKAMTEKLTACRDCEHRLDDPRIHICAVAPFGREFDYMSGKMLRRVDYSTDHIPCRDVNIDGHCPHFQEKERGKADGMSRL